MIINPKYYPFIINSNKVSRHIMLNYIKIITRENKM